MAEELTDEDQSDWEPDTLQDSSAKHGMFPGICLHRDVDEKNDKRIIAMCFY